MKTLGVFGDSWADGSFGHDMLDKDYYYGTNLW